MMLCGEEPLLIRHLSACTIAQLSKADLNHGILVELLKFVNSYFHCMWALLFSGILINFKLFNFFVMAD